MTGSKNAHKRKQRPTTQRTGQDARRSLCRALLLASLTAFTGGQVKPVHAGGDNQTRTILVLGDSLSAEYGIRRGSGWVALLGKKLEHAGLNAKLANASISGETTAGGRSRIDALLAKHKPSLVIIELGANDALRGLDLQSAHKNLTEITTKCQQAGAKVVMLGMRIPPNYGRDYLARFDAMFAAVAKKTGAALVPFWMQSIATDLTMFQPDGLHPTGKAQPLLLEAVWPTLKPMLIGK